MTRRLLLSSSACSRRRATGPRMPRMDLAALAALEEPGIDLALVDLDLPGIDGLQLARLLRDREGEGDRHLPMIAITARATGDEEEQARAAGMDGFLRKPLSSSGLEKAMAPWLANRFGSDGLRQQPPVRLHRQSRSWAHSSHFDFDQKAGIGQRRDLHGRA